MPGIPRNPTAMIAALSQALNAIGNEPNWPANAPTYAEVSGLIILLTGNDGAVESAEDQLRIKREKRRNDGETAYAALQKIDLFTDTLYGPTSANKTAFGVEPKKEAGAPPGPLDLTKPVIVATRDGLLPGSIFVDWSPVDSAQHYEIQASTNPDFTTLVQTRTAASSETQVDGLTKGTQYWLRVRAARSDKFSAYSDPATRVANV